MVHSSAYIDMVRELSEVGEGYLDRGDTPATPSLYQGSLAVTGGTLAATEAVANGAFTHGLNPAGGMHHAHPDRASGFCVFNDLAIAARALQKRHGVERIAIIDIDGHHGDGTQHIFYNEKVLTISLHRYGKGFYPGTGSEREIGKGEGYGYAINVPLPANTPDEAYLHAYRKVVKEALDAYRPEFILHQFGTDAHFGDSLVDLSLTTKAYESIADFTHDLAHKHCDGRYVVTGGGGYNIDAARRVWAIAACAISGACPFEPEGLHHLQDSLIHARHHFAAEDLHERLEYLQKFVLPLIQ
jgi:acetoin utilization protein AcuC